MVLMATSQVSVEELFKQTEHAETAKETMDKKVARYSMGQLVNIIIECMDRIISNGIHSISTAVSMVDVIIRPLACFSRISLRIL